MLLLRRRFLLVLICLISFSAPGYGDELKLFHIHFKLLAWSLILVPVTVNGAGPFEFILDTGSTATTIDPGLAAQLSLPPSGRSVSLDLQGTSLFPLARIAEMEIGGAAVRNLDVLVASMPAPLVVDGKVRGILGEDFLSHFDLLLDNRHRLLQLQQGPAGSMPADLTGERIALKDHGSAGGQLTSHRLLLTAKAPDVGQNELTFQLDSGASLVVLFNNKQTSAWLLRRKQVGLADSSLASHASVRPGKTSSLQALALGGRVLANLTAAVPEYSPPADSDGLLPTCIFQSVYISHSQGFAIFDPVPGGPHAK